VPLIVLNALHAIKGFKVGFHHLEEYQDHDF